MSLGKHRSYIFRRTFSTVSANFSTLLEHFSFTSKPLNYYDGVDTVHRRLIINASAGTAAETILPPIDAVVRETIVRRPNVANVKSAD